MAMFALIVGGYFLVGIVNSCGRAWRIGVHRAEVHKGKRESWCEHWACDMMATEFLMLTLLFWPVVVPVSACFRLFEILMKAPHLRSLPPENEMEERRIDQ